MYHRLHSPKEEIIPALMTFSAAYMIMSSIMLTIIPINVFFKENNQVDEIDHHIDHIWPKKLKEFLWCTAILNLFLFVLACLCMRKSLQKACYLASFFFLLCIIPFCLWGYLTYEPFEMAYTCGEWYTVPLSISLCK